MGKIEPPKRTPLVIEPFRLAIPLPDAYQLLEEKHGITKKAFNAARKAGDITESHTCRNQPWFFVEDLHAWAGKHLKRLREERDGGQGDG